MWSKNIARGRDAAQVRGLAVLAPAVGGVRARLELASELGRAIEGLRRVLGVQNGRR